MPTARDVLTPDALAMLGTTEADLLADWKKAAG